MLAFFLSLWNTKNRIIIKTISIPIKENTVKFFIIGLKSLTKLEFHSRDGFDRMDTVIPKQNMISKYVHTGI